MKKILTIFAIFLLTNFIATAQSIPKLGHIDSRSLLELMPEKSKIQTQLEGHKKELESQIKTMTQEWEAKFNDYQKNEKLMTDIIKQNKAQEIQDLQKRIQEFQQSAQQDLLEKETNLFKPLIEKMQKAIEKVAKDNGYTYILDVSLGTVLYSSESNDVLPLVKKEMNLGLGTSTAPSKTTK